MALVLYDDLFGFGAFVSGGHEEVDAVGLVLHGVGVGAGVGATGVSGSSSPPPHDAAVKGMLSTAVRAKSSMVLLTILISLVLSIAHLCFLFARCSRYLAF